MDKETRNLIMGCMVSAVVGITMGVGIVAPSVETVVVSSTPETMELCINDVISVANALDSCMDTKDAIIEVSNDLSASYEEDITKLQGQFDEATALTEEAQGMTKRSLTAYDNLSESYDQLDGLFGRCMESLEGRGRTSI